MRPASLVRPTLQDARIQPSSNLLRQELGKLLPVRCAVVDGENDARRSHDNRTRHRQDPKPARQLRLGKGIHFTDVHPILIPALQLLQGRLLDGLTRHAVGSGKRQDQGTAVNQQIRGGVGPDHPPPGAAGPTPAAARRADTGLETGPTVGARYSRRESAPGPPPATVGWSARPPPPRWSNSPD